ncbi:hypothetical protein MYX82_10415, partial [Acidobacteria bacterium AH-259-D05]|nr:hypothetical protein [Acidobacteria bacterium AH-259-D05]
LGSTPIHNLPFAFAGDPFQTLNPTGFRWKNLRAAFYEEIVRALDPTGKWNLSTNFEKELTYNYRSTPPIVRATNLILLWRRVLFDDRDLQPQMCWAKGDFPEPQTFIFGENISADEFKKVKDTIIIVPCEKGQEVSYVQQDPILSQIFPNPDKKNPPKNILSPIEAKGLEFKRVILYKFGEKIDPVVWELVRNPREQPVEFEYFFNKLYVAPTRAMRRLFIVDSKKGDQQLWKYASDPTQFEPFLQGTNNPAMWKEHIGLIARGTSSSVSEIHEDNPLSLAQEFKIKGLAEADAGLLRRARQYYSELGYAEEAKLCEAWALKFEEKFEKAGNLFLEINKADNAWECFWQGPCWPELTRYDKRWSKKNAEQSRDLAVFMIASAKETNAIKKFTEFLEKSMGSGRLGNPFSKQWHTVIWEYVRRLSGLSKSNLEQTEWQKSGKILKQLDEAQYDNTLEQAGFCFYHAQDFEGAVDCWKEHAQADRNILSKKEYCLAKAEVVGLPEGLEWLDKAKTYKKIIEEWEKAGGMNVVDARWLQFVPAALESLGEAKADETIIKQWEKAGGLEKQINAQWLELVAGALERKNRHIDAFKLYVRLDKPDLVLVCFKKANLLKAGATRLEKWEDFVLNYLIGHKYWLRAVDVINNGVLGGHDPKRVRLLRRKVVRALGYSDLTPKEITPDHRRRYQRFIGTFSERRSLEEVSEKEIGAALERVGDLDNTLSFYQGFLESNDTELSRFARERWIANRRKQEKEVRNQPGERKRADYIKTEIRDKLRVWGIPPGTVFPEYASLGPHIQGLPVGAKVEETEEGGRKFQVRQITVETNRDGSLISIFDRKSFNTLKIDLVRGDVTGTEEVNVRRLAEDAHLSFEVPGRYSGKAVYTVGERQVELSIEECTIFIQF